MARDFASVCFELAAVASWVEGYLNAAVTANATLDASQLTMLRDKLCEALPPEWVK